MALIEFSSETFGMSPEEVNNGNCEEWALEAQRRFGGEVVWFDDEPYYIAHCALFLNGLYYDAENLTGVTREQLLAKWR
jgi:hypothetical protein